MADDRMYMHKQRRGPSAERQSVDVLVSVLQERDSLLAHHLAGVADLAEAVSRRLKVPPTDLQTIRQAAELHDVGKLAIPEEILSKPGPLTEDEWEFVRRHTLIGERILASAPALRPRPRSSARATSAGTGRATRTSCAPARSRWARGSSRSATRSTR